MRCVPVLCCAARLMHVHLVQPCTARYRTHCCALDQAAGLTCMYSSCTAYVPSQLSQLPAVLHRQACAWCSGAAACVYMTLAVEGSLWPSSTAEQHAASSVVVHNETKDRRMALPGAQLCVQKRGCCAGSQCAAWAWMG
jgi:hypothetical protein